MNHDLTAEHFRSGTLTTTDSTSRELVAGKPARSHVIPQSDHALSPLARNERRLLMVGLVAVMMIAAPLFALAQVQPNAGNSSTNSPSTGAPAATAVPPQNDGMGPQTRGPSGSELERSAILPNATRSAPSAAESMALDCTKDPTKCAPPADADEKAQVKRVLP